MKTQLYNTHVELDAKMVDFAGWQMPLHYGSQIEEHHSVRQASGMFDVSHMLPVDFKGGDSKRLLQLLFAGDVAKLNQDGRAMYTVMLNESGGIIDDLIVYRLANESYRVIFNAGTAQSDLDWVVSKTCSNLSVDISPRHDLNILAIQGPEALSKSSKILGAATLDNLKPFRCIESNGLFIGRTGYTGEDGIEVLCKSEVVEPLWREMRDMGVRPCGLGARDTLRLEAGLNLNGQDMCPDISPLESALGWVVDWDPEERQFIGRQALTQERTTGFNRRLTGIVLNGGIMRAGQEVLTDAGSGVITSGSYSPTLGYSIALARVPTAATGACKVIIRSREKEGRLVRPPFVRKGVKVHK